MNARFLDEPEEESPGFGFVLIAVLLVLAGIASGVFLGYRMGDRYYEKNRPQKQTGRMESAPSFLFSEFSERFPA